MTYIPWSSDFALYLEDYLICEHYYWDMSQYDPKFYLKINIGHSDLYFMVHRFYVTSWRLFAVWTSYFGIRGQYDLTFDLKINVGLCDLYFMVQWLSYISKTIWCMSVIFSDNETVWPKLWPQSKYKSTWPIFHGLVVLLNIFKVIWWMNIIVGIMDRCDTYINLTKYMYVIDLYFMVQRFCFISCRLFDGEMLYLG